MPQDAAAVTPRELVDSTMTFLARHEDALDPASPSRALSACESLHQGLCQTLAAEAARLRNARAQTAAADVTSEAFADALAKARAGDAEEREAWAYASLRKRMAEAEGVLLHLRLTLARGSADGPALPAYVRRVQGETMAARRTLAALRDALRPWTASLDGQTHPKDSPLREKLGAARACPAAGSPRAASRILAEALASSRAKGAPMPERATAAVEDALTAGVDDAVVAWRLLDFVERHVNTAGMPPRATEAAPTTPASEL